MGTFTSIVTNHFKAPQGWSHLFIYRGHTALSNNQWVLLLLSMHITALLFTLPVQKYIYPSVKWYMNANFESAGEWPFYLREWGAVVVLAGTCVLQGWEYTSKKVHFKKPTTQLRASCRCRQYDLNFFYAKCTIFSNYFVCTVTELVNSEWKQALEPMITGQQRINERMFWSCEFICSYLDPPALSLVIIPYAGYNLYAYTKWLLCCVRTILHSNL